MTITNPETEKKLRRGFKIFNIFMTGMWRLGLGKWINAWPEVGGRILVITHHGRKSGKRYRTPVNYCEVNGDIYCTAGFGSGADWYQNILVNPQVEVWMPDSWWAAIAEDASTSLEARGILRKVLIASGFAARIFGIDPKTMPDEEVDELLKIYRIIRLRRVAPRTGKDGPGDLAWIWPLTSFLFFFLWLCKRPRKQ